MKKIILLLVLFCSGFVFGQETATTESGKTVYLNKNGTYKYAKKEEITSTIIKENDIVKIGEDVMFKPKPFYIINGDEKNVEVKFSFSCSFNRYSSISIDDINGMVSTANIKAMFFMKNRRTYVPKKITFFFSERESHWIISIDYVASNDYGGQKDGQVYATFDEIGKFINIM
jgi:hypothetical protein